jgi:hypothetical protein
LTKRNVWKKERERSQVWVRSKLFEESRTKHVGGGATGGSLGSDGGGGEKKKDGRENGADGEERERSTEGPKEGR